MSLHGWDDLAAKLHHMSKTGQWKQLGSQMPDEVLDEFVVGATYPELRSAVEQGGAVSGDCPSGTPYPCLFVDEVSWQRLHETFAEIHRLCGAEAQQGSLARDTAGQT